MKLIKLLKNVILSIGYVLFVESKYRYDSVDSDDTLIVDEKSNVMDVNKNTVKK